MKTFKLLLSAAVSLPVMFIVLLSSCSKDDEPEQNLPQIEVRMEGSISHTVYEPNKTVSISFSRIPVSVKEFKALREQIGKEPQGAVALTVIGIAMYSQFGQKIGEDCLELCNTNTGYTDDYKARLYEWYVKKTNDPRPYQAAAFIKGATPENGYNPSKPYKMTMYVEPGVPYTSSIVSGYGTVITLRLLYSGSESSEDISVAVVEASDGYYKVHSNGSMYMKVKAIANGQTYNGL